MVGIEAVVVGVEIEEAGQARGNIPPLRFWGLTRSQHPNTTSKLARLVKKLSGVI
jgi:hypothetical protein